MRDTEGWIEHNGKGMPVGGETRVLVRFRDGGSFSHPDAAAYWHEAEPYASNWVWDGGDVDIVAYKVVS